MHPSLGFLRRSLVIEILISLRGYYAITAAKLRFERLATPQKSGDLVHQA
jgi:hypothetical protein